MVAKIVIIKDQKPVDQVILGTKALILGRKSDCDISIKDPAISGSHARIFVDGGLFVIEDMGSTNGIMVAGERVERHVFKNNDTVEVGEHQLRFLMPEVAAAAVAPAKKAAVAATQPEAPASAASSQPAAGAPAAGAPAAGTPAAGTPAAGTPAAGTPAAGTPAAGTPAAGAPATASPTRPADLDAAFLLVVGGAGKGNRIELQQTLTTVGEPGIQVAAVSRRPKGHFIVHVDGGKEKDRVPLVNGEPTGFRSRMLEPGDIIEVADIRLEYNA